MILVYCSARAIIRCRAEHRVQWVWRMRNDHIANETVCKQANNVENAQIKPNSTATNVRLFLPLSLFVRNSSLCGLPSSNKSQPSLIAACRPFITHRATSTFSQLWTTSSRTPKICIINYILMLGKFHFL